MSRRVKLSTLILVMMMPFLSGCDEYLLGPLQYASSHHREIKDETWGGTMGEAEEALYDYGSTGVIVGFEHFFDNSGGLRIHNHIHRGAVKFNQKFLEDIAKKPIKKATFQYRIRTGKRTALPGFHESCANRIFLATGEWKGLPSDEPQATFPGEEIGVLPEAPIGTKVELDVTPIVKQWATRARPNHGFVIAHDKEPRGLFRDNNACWTLLDQLELKIEMKH